MVPTCTSQYAPKVALSCLQSGFGLPNTMAAGLNVCDIPSLGRKAFNQPTMSTMFSSTISLGAFLYGSSTQQHLTCSLSVLMDHSTRGTCSLAAQISTYGPTSPLIFLNFLSALMVSILNPRFLVDRYDFLYTINDVHLSSLVGSLLFLSVVYFVKNLYCLKLNCLCFRE